MLAEMYSRFCYYKYTIFAYLLPLQIGGVGILRHKLKIASPSTCNTQTTIRCIYTDAEYDFTHIPPYAGERNAFWCIQNRESH